MQIENGEHCLMLLFHYHVHICTFVVFVELSDVDAKVLVEAPVSSGVIEGKYCIKIRLILAWVRKIKYLNIEYVLHFHFRLKIQMRHFVVPNFG